MKHASSRFMAAMVILPVLLLSACNLNMAAGTPTPTQDMNRIYTEVAATIALQYTQTAAAMPTATYTAQPTATETPSPTLAPSATVPLETPTQRIIHPTFTPVIARTETANGCYNANFVADVTIPAGTNFKPGDKFTKTWRLKNTGTCDWDANFKIVYVGGDLFGSDTTQIRQTVAVNHTVDISLDMVAPSGAGAVFSNWQLSTADGKFFGPVVSASIVLPGGVTNTPSNPSNGSATPSSSCYDAKLISETIIAGTKMEPGEKFTKVWTIKNTGKCEWSNDFKIVFLSGNSFGSDTTKIRKTVAPGATVEIALEMVAPDASGNATSSWQLLTSTGELFGPSLTVQITVK